VGSEWRLQIFMSAEEFVAWVIGDSAALGEEEIGEECSFSSYKVFVVGTFPCDFPCFDVVKVRLA
jgi:hypothetical protein